MPVKKLDQKGVIGSILIALIIFFLLVFAFVYISNRDGKASAEIKSGYSGYCLDVHKNKKPDNSEVDSWGCNGSAAQNWIYNQGLIEHGTSDCLNVVNKKIVSSNCNGSASQVWLRYLDGYQNPNTGQCLSVPAGQVDVQLTLGSCGTKLADAQIWNPVSLDGIKLDNSCNVGSEGQRVSCYAEQDWSVWQTGTPNHSTLLNNYSDGNSYEEWCADFVSYVYQQAGYAFTQGERNGWDEYNANNIQYQGFTYHAAAGYTPKVGDVAFFDYPGGHVEIVVSGGAQPTYVYGDSATIDPTTGNGQMEANTISNESLGSVTYYLSPNKT